MVKGMKKNVVEREYRFIVKPIEDENFETKILVIRGESEESARLKIPEEYEEACCLGEVVAK